MTTDKFIAAVQELGDAIGSGEPLDQALADVAEEHGLRPEALRNRAARDLGDLAVYSVQRATREQRERDWAQARRLVIARAAERGTTMTAEQADSYIGFVGVEHATAHAIKIGPQPTSPTWDDE